MFSRSLSLNIELHYSRVLDLAEDVVEDTSVLEVCDFWVSVESASDSEGLSGAGLDLNVLANLEVTTLHVDIKGFLASQTVSICTLALLKLKGKYTHTNEIGSVDALV